MDLYIEIEKCFPKIVKYFSDKTLLEFTQALPSNLWSYNDGLGTMIRLKLLRPKSILYRKFVQSGISDRDEMSLVIIKQFHKHITQ